jgi:hypothetical protein
LGKEALQKQNWFDNFNGRDILADLGVGIIIFDSREIGCEHVKPCILALDKEQWQACVNTMLIL